MQKSEGGEIRPVVKTGNEVNRKMDFLSEVVEKGLYGSKVSTLFAGASGNEQIDMDWMRMAVLTTIGDVCIASTDLHSDFRRVWESLWISLMGYRVEVRLGSETLTWGNGIPSGWRWTALLDTMLNYCSLMVIRDVKQSQIGRGIPPWAVCVQDEDPENDQRPSGSSGRRVQLYAGEVRVQWNLKLLILWRIALLLPQQEA
ncbi:hypothetical protein ACJJTC_018843 [Scirpophaga incertulas]